MGCALAASAGAAQSAEPVVLLAPEEVRSEWTAALQVELAARGALAIPREAPDAATALLGDAEAQRVAIEQGASAAVWVETQPGSWRLRMLSPTAERARVVPVAQDADARTVALIIVSLLDDAPAPPPAPPAEPPAPVVIVEAPPEAAPEAARRIEVVEEEGPAAAVALDDPAEVDDSRTRSRAEPYVHWAGLIGVSGLPRAEGGFSLRAGIAMRYDWLEATVLHDLGLFHESVFRNFQLFARTCLEVGGATSRTEVAFHAGVRGCAGSIFRTELQFDTFFSTLPRMNFSGGAYAGVSIPLERWIRLHLRGDLDLGVTDMPVTDVFEVMPGLAAILSFE